jgi:hypothetical protein
MGLSRTSPESMTCVLACLADRVIMQLTIGGNYYKSSSRYSVYVRRMECNLDISGLPMSRAAKVTHGVSLVRPCPRRAQSHRGARFNQVPALNKGAPRQLDERNVSKPDRKIRRSKLHWLPAPVQETSAYQYQSNHTHTHLTHTDTHTHTHAHLTHTDTDTDTDRQTDTHTPDTHRHRHRHTNTWHTPGIHLAYTHIHTHTHTHRQTSKQTQSPGSSWGSSPQRQVKEPRFVIFHMPAQHKTREEQEESPKTQSEPGHLANNKKGHQSRNSERTAHRLTSTRFLRC